MEKRKSLSQIRRAPATKAPNLRIVLVCEGEKTERIYFSLFIEELKAVNVHLELPPRECGTDPVSIIDFGIQIFEGDPLIDVCFCVIDRDTHENFDTAIAKSLTYQDSVQSPRKFQSIVSNPSIEYWFLLHFTPTTKPYVRAGNKSPADVAKSDLKARLPKYAKNDRTSIASLLDKTDTAIANSKQTFRQAIDSGSMNPSSEVHIVVSMIKDLSKQK